MPKRQAHQWEQSFEAELFATERTKPKVCSLHIEDFVTDSADKYAQKTSTQKKAG
jgi:hypothetical protein